MLHHRLALPALLALAGLLTAGGCASDNSLSDASLDGTTSPAAGPITEEQNPKKIRWENATRGLNFDSGRVIVDAAGEQTRPAATADFNEGVADLRQRNDYVGAIGHFRDALAHWQDFPEAYDALGDALRGEGKTEWTVASYRTALDAQPENSDIRFKLAMQLWGAEKSEEAVAEMRRVLEIEPDRADAHERLAIWNYYMGDYAAAWRHVHETRALGSDVPPQFVPLLEQRMPDPRAAGAG